MDHPRTGLLSFHCEKRQVFAALWSQPRAVPCTLGAIALKPTLEDPNSLLTWRGQARLALRWPNRQDQAQHPTIQPSLELQARVTKPS
ncbi:hypothetical protein DCAR_0416159 [Daucus carota subsp. sativus]|uniref:Uncharacterized protein n=1 Tax=Daucus carota subsp. sativus TaxID=79200 RepID=A0A165X7N8_DAUCS|nr:hypothetical protein DCAR_0416159 [Daucus carota subsp. sativus]